MLGCLRGTAICACLFALTLGPAASVLAQSEEEMDILQMIYKDKDLVTPTRSPKPVSQVAENVTVINAEEIEAINAHTLADVLLYVTGVQMDIRGGPGSISNVLIQGSDRRHVQVMVDGISLNNLSDNFPDIGAFPVQRIERIEIIKGPSSSSWGSSLAGIINVITKSPDPERRMGGMASASIGERATGDYRLELSGTTGTFGYYLSAGGMSGDGLNPSNPYNAGNLYTKLQWNPTASARFQLSVAYDKGSRGEGQFPSIDPLFAINDTFEYFYLTPSFKYVFNDSLSIDLSARVFTKRNKQSVNQFGLGTGPPSIADELNAGGSANLSWRKGHSNLSVGADYDHGALETAGIKDGRQVQDRWALFANDTFSFRNISITPGVRYDHTSTNGDFWSPSLGVTYTLFDRTIFRAYAARGFNTPPLFFTFGDGIFSLANPDLRPEEVWSYSGGVETSVARFFWIKATYFLHYIHNVITFNPDTRTNVNGGSQKRQGLEAEIRTVPLWSTSLMAGFSLIDATAKNPDTGQRQRSQDVPHYTWDVGIDYDNDDILKGALRGHYIWWNAESDFEARYKAMIWDLNLSKKFLEKGGLALEAFFTAHNIFNGSQYLIGIFPNPRRWFEGGLRFKF